MTRKIRKAAVIGSGVMGGGIAALLASIGVKTLLLDIVPFDLKEAEKTDPVARNRIATHKARRFRIRSPWLPLTAAVIFQPALVMINPGLASDGASGRS